MLVLLPFLAVSVVATITEIPSIFPAIAPVYDSSSVDVSPYLKKRPSDFVHPGIWHTHDDLERMRDGVNNGKEPWATAFQYFSADQFSQSNYTQQGPKAILERGAISNYTSFTYDTRAAWQNALMWYITQDQAHWDRSTTLLDAWGSNLTNIIGTDRSLLTGLEGDLFVNAAEIMRWEGNWTEAGARWQGGSGFSNQLYWLFLQQNGVVGQANYGMVSIKALMSFAVYLDDVTMYNYAINQYINNPCASVYSLFEPDTGQSSEAGRDQGE